MSAVYEELGIEKVRELASIRPKFWGWTTADGNQMFVAGNDDMIALRFHNGYDYEPATRGLWKKCCSKAEIAIDVGTHSGIFTLDAHRAGAKSVISVEPHPINYARLVMNMRMNDFPTDGVFIGGAGDKNSIEMLLVKDIIRVHAAGRIGMENDNGVKVPVRVARLDSLMPPEKYASVGIVKIDAENLTPAVLYGMPGILSHRPDLIIECTEEGLSEKLKPLGYKFWRIWEEGNFEQVDDLTPHNPGNNYNGTHENCRNRFASVRGLP